MKKRINPKDIDALRREVDYLKLEEIAMDNNPRRRRKMRRRRITLENKLEFFNKKT